MWVYIMIATSLYVIVEGCFFPQENCVCINYKYYEVEGDPHPVVLCMYNEATWLYDYSQ